jgi:hypothetical protein
MRNEAMARSRRVRGWVVLGALAFLAAPMLSADARADAILSSNTPPVFTQNAGDGDAFAEPGEEWKIDFQLSNAGDLDATNINAVLTSSAPGIVVLGGTTTYATLAPMANGTNQAPLSFAITSDAPCGATVGFTLTVTFGGGALPEQVFDFTGKVGSPGTPVTFSYAGGPVAIPDGADLSGANPGAQVWAGVLVNGVAGNLYDVDLSIDGSACTSAIGATTVGIDHTFVSDLEITLIAPDNTNVRVIDNADGSGNNFCQTLLDDDAGAGTSRAW